MDTVSSNRLTSIRKFQVPVVGMEYVSQCLEKGRLLNTGDYPPAKSQRHSPPPATTHWGTVFVVEALREDLCISCFRIYRENEAGLPAYPSDFKVAKYLVLKKADAVVVVELHSCKGNPSLPFRVTQLWRSPAESGTPCFKPSTFQSQAPKTKKEMIFTLTSEDAMMAYRLVLKELKDQGFSPMKELPSDVKLLGGVLSSQLLLEQSLNSSTISKEVAVFVELLWTEALGRLSNLLLNPISSVSSNDVSRAEGILQQLRKALSNGANQGQLFAIMAEFYRVLPHKNMADTLITPKVVSQKEDLCQLIRDIINVSEATLWSSTPSSLAKYRALRCSIEHVDPGTAEFFTVKELVKYCSVEIHRVLRVCRVPELLEFKRELGNVRPLLHASAPSNFVGILSRGLLLPKVAVEQHGVKRTDLGNLGSGIYFSDSMRTSMSYAKPTVTDGTRLLVVCDVALGECRDLRSRDPSLVSAPTGCHSVHGVRQTPQLSSDFQDDEYVVYNTNQTKIKYVVQFSEDYEEVKAFEPTVDISTELSEAVLIDDSVSEAEADCSELCKNPLEGMMAGLQDSAGKLLPLQRVHVKGRVIDLLAEIIIFQTYTNHSTVPIEAKYVFPLDESAAVCGFEAFINGKHLVGEVKEKEQARREYRQAIEKGHGAYLMDQDAPDVFTISVGNLPPNATVLIKITYVTELSVSEGAIVFRLPGSVAPWQQSSALNERTQDTVNKVCVTDMETERRFDLEMSVEMPYEMTHIRCPTHNIKMKRTQCKAVISTVKGDSLGPDGFLLSLTLSEMHLPRMWVEKHPDKDSQACMLVFYPAFESNTDPGEGEVVILLDTSNSMRGETLQNARRIALLALKALNCKVNILFFGTDFKELFPCSEYSTSVFESAKNFIMSAPPMKGSTDLWRPLRSLSLLAPSKGTRNLLLISDGHVQNEGLTLRLAQENVQHTRIFTCGVGSTANRHMLRSLAQSGGGAYEFFDTKMKHTWEEKVQSQVRRMASPGCSAVSVKWQQFHPSAPPPIQAPSQLHSLFNDCRQLVYGFVPHCTMATLLGKVSDQEIETMVSTSELQKTKGTLLHKLTARAVIRDYEDGSLHMDETEHEVKKSELKSYIVSLSKEFSIVTQYTSFVAIEERGRISYRVRWKGYTSEDDTWEPEAHLADCKEVLHAFRRKQSESKAKKESVKLPMKSDLFDADSESDGEKKESSPKKKKKKKSKETEQPDSRKKDKREKKNKAEKVTEKDFIEGKKKQKAPKEHRSEVEKQMDSTEDSLQEELIEAQSDLANMAVEDAVSESPGLLTSSPEKTPVHKPMDSTSWSEQQSSPDVKAKQKKNKGQQLGENKLKLQGIKDFIQERKSVKPETLLQKKESPQAKLKNLLMANKPTDMMAKAHKASKTATDDEPGFLSSDSNEGSCSVKRKSKSKAREPSPRTLPRGKQEDAKLEPNPAKAEKKTKPARETPVQRPEPDKVEKARKDPRIPEAAVATAPVAVRDSFEVVQSPSSETEERPEAEKKDKKDDAHEKERLEEVRERRDDFRERREKWEELRERLERKTEVMSPEPGDEGTGRWSSGAVKDRRRRREDSEPRLYIACDDNHEARDPLSLADKTSERAKPVLNLGVDLKLDWMTLEDFQKHLNGEDDILTATTISSSELRESVKSGDYLTVKLALNSKEDYNLDQEDSSGMSLAMLAAAGGQDDILRLLIKKGVKVNARQKAGNTALMHAADKNFLTTVAILLEAGAYVNAQQNSGETALMKACKKGNADIVRLLLEYGADCNILSKHQNSAQHYAKLHNSVQVYDLIKAHMDTLSSVAEDTIRDYFETRLVLLEPVFPLACHRLCEGPDFAREFTYKPPHNPTEGSGILLFIFHANFFGGNEITARLCGPCSVQAVVLNDKFQLPVFLDSHFIYSFSPVQGLNKLFIRLAEAPTAKVKLLICAYRVQLQ
ncbi:PARP4 polymerase, partial [Amia calva]|nr:PARP4 polymerase [Amia calva]